VYDLTRPFLFLLDAERAHGLGLAALETAYRTGLNPLVARRPKPLKTKAFGIEFPNPVGLAAGLDKNGDHIDALMALGFGFVEIGTVTPRPQDGNPKPRMFRLPDKRAVINRLGFNNAGVDALVRNVEKARRNGILGINIGKNKDTPNERAADDYIHCLEKVFALADYVTVNIPIPPACATCSTRRRCGVSSASCAARRRSWPACTGTARRCWSRSRPTCRTSSSTALPRCSMPRAWTVSS
jgi:dihydroorotate dehydrogenase